MQHDSHDKSIIKLLCCIDLLKNDLSEEGKCVWMSFQGLDII